MHFKTGLDDKDHRLGCAPLKRLAREVSSDDQATRYADRLLANLAINGLSMEFDKEMGPIDRATADEMKARIQSAYSGDNVGAVSVLSPGAKLVQHGFSPEQMDLKVLHRVPEERISAVLRCPAIVAGLGARLTLDVRQLRRGNSHHRADHPQPVQRRRLKRRQLASDFTATVRSASPKAIPMRALIRRDKKATRRVPTLADLDQRGACRDIGRNRDTAPQTRPGWAYGAEVPPSTQPGAHRGTSKAIRRFSGTYLKSQSGGAWSER
jgi:hypothetical protein